MNLAIVSQEVTLYHPENHNRALGRGWSVEVYQGDFCIEVFEARTKREALDQLFAAHPEYLINLVDINVQDLGAC